MQNNKRHSLFDEQMRKDKFAKQKDWFAVLLIVVTVIMFFKTTGTVTSGFHFTDDHEIIGITHDLSHASTFDVIKKWIRYDLTIRYRPMHYIHRVLETKLFGANFKIWSIYNVFLMCSSMLAFYLGMRKLKFSMIESLCFLPMIFFGEQTAIWWRLGPNEAIGIFFLSLSFFFMTSYKENRLINNSLFCFFLICSSLSKESFTVIIPAFLFFKIWHDKQVFNLTIKQTILRNKLLIIPLCVLIINIIIILFFVGTTKIGYAGVELNGLSNLLKGIYLIIKDKLINFIAIIIFYLIVVYRLITKKEEFILLTEKLILPIVFCSMIVVPNLILYSKSGMHERYLLPCLIGVAFLIVSIIKEIRFYAYRLSLVFLSVVLLGCSTLYTDAKTNASNFTLQGQQTHLLLNTIINNYNDSSNMLLVADPVASFEWSVSLKTYLAEARKNKLYAYAIEGLSVGDPKEVAFNNDLKNAWYPLLNNKKLSDIKGNPDVLIFLNKTLADSFFKQSGVSIEKYVNVLDENTPFALFMFTASLNEVYNRELTIDPIKGGQPFSEKTVDIDYCVKQNNIIVISITPQSEITGQQKAFIILFDNNKDWSSSIVFHNQIIGNGQIILKKIIGYEMKKPRLIIRNWQSDESIKTPPMKISFSVFSTQNGSIKTIKKTQEQYR